MTQPGVPSTITLPGVNWLVFPQNLYFCFLLWPGHLNCHYSYEVAKEIAWVVLGGGAGQPWIVREKR